MDIQAEFRLDDLMANGTYNVTGWLGWSWVQVDSEGPQPFQIHMLNTTLSPQVKVDAVADCDEEGNAKVTELNIPLKYDSLDFDMENLDDAFKIVLQGILVLVIEAQNMLAVAALRGMIASSIGSLMCQSVA